MKALLAAILLVSPFVASARDALKIDASKLEHPVKAALWKIEGKGLSKASYLFGTIHLGDPRITTLHPKAEQAFTASDHFYAEIDLDPAKQVALAAHLKRKDGKTLSQSIGPETSKKLDAALKKINPALGSEDFESMKTWVIYMTLPILELQLANKKPLDTVLYDRAMKAGKKVGGVETTESHFKIMDDLTEKEQIKLLEETLGFMKDEELNEEDSIRELVDLYLTSDVYEIGVMLKKYMDEGLGENDELSKRLIKSLLDDRNITMTETITQKLAENPGSSQFFAIGAAHYTGPTAIQDLLTKKGYTITPTFN